MSGPGQQKGSVGSVWAVFLLLQGLAYALYARTFGADWTYDDFPVIVNNPDIQSWQAFVNNSRPGRPLRELTYLVDHSLFGMAPWGWHLQQIFWHGLNGFLVYLLALALGGGRRLGLLAGGLFLFHPLQVEVVANLSHRKDSLLLAAALAAVLAYQRFLASERIGQRSLWLGCAVAGVIVACLAKQTGVILPAVFVVLEWTTAPRARRFLARSNALLAVFALVLVAAGIFMLGGEAPWGRYQKGMVGLLQLRAGWTGEVTLGLYLLMVLKSWSFMWLKLFWPFDLALEYTYDVPTGVIDPWVLATLVGLGLMVCFLLVKGRTHPMAAFALTWFLLFWLPVANLWPQTYFAADRYLYAPTVGICLMMALLLDKMADRWRSESLGLALVMILALGLLTWQQVPVWQNSLTLWQNAVKVSPGASFALNNLGWNYLKLGDVTRAEGLFLRATENPYNPNPHDNLGWLYEQQGRWPEAAGHYRRFIEIAGRDAKYRERSEFLNKYLVQQEKIWRLRRR